MAVVVSLNRARKAKRRAEDAASAAANRVAFGRTKAQKLADRAEGERRDHALDQAKRDD